MTKTAPSAVVTGIALAAIVGVVFGTDTAAPVWKQGEWIRLIITGIALVIAAYIVWKNRSEIALQDSVSALKIAVDAHKMESEALARRVETLTKEKAIVEAECISLKAKTDVGEILKILTTLSSNTFKMLEDNGEVLREIQRKVNGWKFDRRDALRESDSRPGPRQGKAGHYGSFEETQHRDRQRDAGDDSGNRRNTRVRGSDVGEKVDERGPDLGGHYRIPPGKSDE